MKVVIESTVVTKSIDRQGNVRCTIQVPDTSCSKESSIYDLLHLKSDTLELGQKVTVTIDDGF